MGANLNWRPAATYPYHDESGKPLFRVVRLERGEGSEREKTFYQQRYENGEWINGLADVRRVPYRLHKILIAKRVFLVEGEKDVNTLRAQGLTASTNPMGAGNWSDEYAVYFTGKSIVIIPDNDDAGRAHVLDQASSLLAVAKSVRIVELPRLAEKEDVTDWVEAGGMADELKQLTQAAEPLTKLQLLELRHRWGLADADHKLEFALARIDALKPDLELQELEGNFRPIFRDLGANAVQREIVREASIKKLRETQVSSPARIIDAVMGEYKPRFQAADDAIVLNDIEPWPEPVDGESLVEEIAATVCRYVFLTRSALVAVALWILLTYTIDAIDCLPNLNITSPEKRCGKTRLLSVLNVLVARPLPVSNITPAAVFRTIEAVQPTLLIDEADTFLSKNDELRGVINSGHTRDTAYVVRLVGENHEPKRFSTFCPKAIAQIGQPPQTIQDRSITILLRRKTASESVERWNRKVASTLKDLPRKCLRWVGDNLHRIESATPDVPDLGNDRAEDNWTPILAIAEVVGGDFPEKVRAAAQKISGASTSDDDSPGVLLLADLREMFLAMGVNRLPSKVIVGRLASMEHRPWPEWKGGKPITATQLSQLLKPFGIRPGTIRGLNGATPKGYTLAQFSDAFERYIPGVAATTPQ